MKAVSFGCPQGFEPRYADPESDDHLVCGVKHPINLRFFCSITKSNMTVSPLCRQIAERRNCPVLSAVAGGACKSGLK